MTALRRELHDHPAPSHHEEGTANRVRAFLEGHGVRVEPGVGGHGLLVRLGTGPCRLLRADLDALPDGDGARHGCGHDGHAAMLAGAVVRLAQGPPVPSVAALWQPAEEDGSGMAACLEDPRVADLPVTGAFALHNLPGEPLGSVVVGPGALASTGLRLTLEGAEAHAAHPEQGDSPWNALRSLADRVPDLPEPADGPSALATLVHVRLGREAYGTSPGRGVVAATLRGPGPAVARMGRAWSDAARRAAEADGLRLRVQEVDPFPETRNTPSGLDDARRAAEAAGLEVGDRDEPFSWSEDVGHAVARWGGALVGLGAGEATAPLHDPRYAFPDDLLEPGIRFWTHLARLP